MIKLSDRLQYIADRIKEGETMADIGTDHGFLPVFLLQSGKCPYVIMADVSPLSLDKARGTAASEDMDEKYTQMMDFRAGDGLAVVEKGEVDSVAIAGMGGKLIRDIMAADPEKTYSVKKFIMQPRIGQGHLRKWLIDNGFTIIEEGVVHEGRHIPEIITAITPGNGLMQGEDMMKRIEREIPHLAETLKSTDAEDIRWRIPPWIIYASGPVDEFLLRNKIAEEEKLSNVRRAKVRNMTFEEKISGDIEYLKELQNLHKEYCHG